MMKAVETWRRFWFQPQGPEALGICRILFYGALLFLYGGEDYTFCAPLAEVLWHPIPLFQLLSLDHRPTVEGLVWTQALWKAGLIASMAGLATRVATSIAFALGLYLTGLVYSVSRLSHEMAAPVLMLAVMALSRCGDTFSLDRWIGARMGKAKPLIPHAEYRWPIQLGRVMICLVFFTAGLSKWRKSGLDWVLSSNLQILIANREMPLGRWIAQWLWPCQILAGATMVMEFFHSFALFSKKLAWIFVPGGLLLLLGFRAFMGVPFWPLVFLHIFWVPWESVWSWLQWKLHHLAIRRRF